VRNALQGSSEAQFQVEWLRTLAEGLRRLADPSTGEVDAIVADVFLADSDGIGTFDGLFGAAPQIPILLLIDSTRQGVAKLAVHCGAQDYLLKSRFDDYLLPKAVSNMIERAAVADALYMEKERAQITLNSIGDAVISTDQGGAVSFLNQVAENLTGWTLEAAYGRPVDEVFRIIDGNTREPAQNPMALAMRENRTVGLTADCVLIRRDCSESPIEDSAAPIHDRQGNVTGAVMVFHDVSKARARSLKLSHLAQHDALTDLPNRSLFDDRLGRALALAQRHRSKLAILYVDIDRFKHVNDTSGHAVGDRLLQSIAQRLLGCIRNSDTVSRQGGDEFVILLGEVANAKDAALAAEKMLVALAGPHGIDDLQLRITASIGIATYPMDGIDGETLCKNADAAMYRAKNCGRNNFQFFKAEMNLHALERQDLETDLRHALERCEFELHYQPQVSLRTGAITGCEALLRWRHPTRRLVRPGRFIDIAEQSGLIVPMGRWVLHDACSQAQAWQGAGLPPVLMSVNVSAVELLAMNFVAGVRSALDHSGLAARHLAIEITETALMRDDESTRAVLQEISDIGVHIALDDFGTGYSSLSHLKRFPIDILKIDQTFVRHITTHEDDASIVGAMVRMGRSLHVLVVAEGVETHAQRMFLKRLQCPEAQGYFFGKPLLAGAFADRLARQPSADVRQPRASDARALAQR